MTPLAKANGFLGHMQVYNPALTPNGSIRAGRNLFTTEGLVLSPSGRRLRGLLLSTLRVEAQKNYIPGEAAIPLSAKRDSPLAVNLWAEKLLSAIAEGKSPEWLR